MAQAPRVPTGGRLELGEFATETKEGVTLFFLTSSGSVNRDPESPQKWYYRAGVERGAQEITLYRVGKGILPLRERLRVEVFLKSHAAGPEDHHVQSRRALSEHVLD